MTNLETFFLNNPALSTNIGGICAGIACFIGSTYIKGVDFKNTSTKGTSIESTCTGGAGAVEHSRIYLSFFLILEVKLLV